MVNKRLVFNFQAKRGYTDEPFYKAHLACLEHYAGVFDEAVFVISVKDINDIVLIDSVKHDIVSLFNCRNITIITEKLDEYYESRVFYDMVYKKLGQLDGLTFFAHTKGVCDENFKFDEKAGVDFIASLYYLSLSDVDEVSYKLIHDKSMFYGTFMNTNGGEYMMNKNQYHYLGGFYWLNSTLVNKYIDFKKLGEFNLTDRYFNESFPGEILEPFNLNATKNMIYYGGAVTDIYDMIKGCIGPNVDDYLSFKEKVGL